jgi:hypothetical protein
MQGLPPSHSLWRHVVTQAADLLLGAQLGLPGGLQNDAGPVLAAVSSLLQQLVSVSPFALLQLPARVREAACGSAARGLAAGAALANSMCSVADIAEALAGDVRSRYGSELLQCCVRADFSIDFISQLLGAWLAAKLQWGPQPSQPSQPC